MRETGLWLCLLYLLGINLLAFLAFGRDKALARQGRFRIPEAVLFTVAIIGGSIGSIVGMFLFHHKIRMAKFRFGLPLILVLQIGFIVLLRSVMVSIVFL